jgi:hypothetical protein
MSQQIAQHMVSIALVKLFAISDNRNQSVRNHIHQWMMPVPARRRKAIASRHQQPVSQPSHFNLGMFSRISELSQTISQRFRVFLKPMF